MTDDLPVCEDHAHLPVRLKEIKEFYETHTFLIPEDITYLIGQAEWAIRLDYAGQKLNLSAARYIEELETGNGELREKLDHEVYGNKILRENINKLTYGKAFPTE